MLTEIKLTGGAFSVSLMPAFSFWTVAGARLPTRKLSSFAWLTLHKIVVAFSLCPSGT